jgi:hypothetical protein
VTKQKETMVGCSTLPLHFLTKPIPTSEKGDQKRSSPKITQPAQLGHPKIDIRTRASESNNAGSFTS